MDRLFGRKKHAASPDGPSAAAASPSSAAAASSASAPASQHAGVGPPPLLANDPTYNEAILHLNAALRLEDAGADLAGALTEYDIGLQLALGLLKRLPRAASAPQQHGAGAGASPVDPSVEKSRDLLRGVIDRYMSKAEQLKLRKMQREGNGPPPAPAARAHSNGSSAASPALRSGASSSASPTSSVASPSSAASAAASVSSSGYKANVDPALRAAIESEILLPSSAGSAVSFKDIIGMDDVKAALNEMVILPSFRPDLFSGLRAPPRGLLLYGPPGNGKSFVAAAVAGESHCTFFSVSAATLVSKHLGEGERLVRALFSIARERSPAIIFVDEIDSILSRRSSDEHEASRRLKTEFLIQFDSGKGEGEARVIVLAATNIPEELDEALIRRMTRRIYIPSPDTAARRTMLTSMLSHPSLSHALSKNEVERLVSATEGYSNSDLKALVSDAALGPLRSLSPSQLLSTPADKLPAVQWAHFESALHKIRPSVSKERLMEYEKWSKKQEGGR